MKRKRELLGLFQTWTPLLCCPEGTSENSPAFQRWVGRQKVASPEGTAEIQSHNPSLSFSRPFGTCMPCRMFPGVKTPGYSQDVPPGQRNVAAAFSDEQATFVMPKARATLISMVCLLSIFISGLGKEVEEKQTLRKTFAFDETAGAKAVEVDNFEGSIQVTGYEGREVHLVVNETLEADSQERALKARRKVRLDIRQTNNTVRCSVDGPFRCRNCSISFRGWEHCGYKLRYDFELKVPQQTGLRVKTVNGRDVEIEKTSGKFDVENINGGIRMTDISGAGRVYALNGKVRVRFAENPRADCYFGSLNGNVEVTFRPGLSANARLKTFNGKAYSDFPVSYLAADKPMKKSENGKFVYKSGEFQGVRIGEGGPELKFDAFNGNIRILSHED